MKQALFAIAAMAASLAASSALASQTYTDTQGVVWTIEGTDAPVENWRPFPNSAQACPTHHVMFEHRQAGSNGAHFDEVQKARGDQTWHIKCIRGPVGPTPAMQSVPAPGPQAPTPQHPAQIVPEGNGHTVMVRD